ncbi:DUF930 domain-containing protein [Cupriavidus gilardii]|uniref:DUF930 domain-containing protein n=1 Tax=Cupriavidus gilardii TaxID=82541 RepID=UPI0015725661|nr:DUF930 domain-containing protein [Cupriavidus gilardii]NSX03495.1 DUF930 domain-containing protein [Cupriavidus gilardii]
MARPNRLHRALLATLFAMAACPAVAQDNSPLNDSQRQALDRAIDTLRTPADRNVASQWSDAKKVAEVMCRPLALQELKRTDAKVDRVFLGDDTPQSLTLKGNTVLEGSGQARSRGGWRNFTFTCALDPETARARSFEAKFHVGK